MGDKTCVPYTLNETRSLAASYTTRSATMAAVAGKVGWGFLGCGRIAHDMALALRCVPGSHVAAVGAGGFMPGSGGMGAPESTANRAGGGGSGAFSGASARAAAFGSLHGVGEEATFGNYDGVLAHSGVDVVYVATLNTTHAELVTRSLDAGKHVLCEKPLGVGAAEIKDMAAAARANGRLLVEGVWTSFFPAYQRAMHLVRTGAIGEVRAAHADFGVVIPREAAPRLYDPEAAGGCLLDLGIYPTSFAVDCFGQARPRHVHATGGLTDEGVEEWATLSLDYGAGRHAMVTATMTAQTEERWLVAGSHGSVTLHGYAHAPTRLTVRRWDPCDGDTRSHQTVEVEEFPSGPAGSDPGAGYNFPGSEGLAYEAQAVHDAVVGAAVALECDAVPLTHSLVTAEILDEARRQLGVVLPSSATSRPPGP